MVRAGVGAVEPDPVASEESAEPVVHRVQGCNVEQPTRQPALVGDDDQSEARVLKGTQRRADIRLQD